MCKQCYVCDANIFDHRPERVNPFADEDEVNNELCDDCYKEAVNDYKIENYDYDNHPDDMRDEEYQRTNCI